MLASLSELSRQGAAYYHQLKNNFVLTHFSPRQYLKLSIYGINICALLILSDCLFLTLMFYNPKILGSTASWLSIAVAAIALWVMSIIGLRGSYLVSLELLLSYFWGVSVFISALTLAVVSCLDSYLYMDIWVRHSWEEPVFSWLRSLYCRPQSTASGKCLAPIVANVTDWCVANFNSTDCSTIRREAVVRTESLLQTLTLSLGLVEIVTIILIFVSIYMCFKILTPPVITQSMNDIINYLLLLPMAACVGLSWYLLQFANQSTYFEILAYLFIALAVGQVIALPLGIAAGRLKSLTLISFYVLLIFMITMGYLGGAIMGLLFAKKIFDGNQQPTLLQTENIACQKTLGCCCCNQKGASENRNHTMITGTTFNRCPEWTNTEIITLLSLDLKISAFVAIVSVIYLTGALTVGLIVWQNLRNYKSASI